MNVCRGCGGTGIDQHVTPREAQVATEGVILSAPGGRQDRELKLGSPVARYRTAGVTGYRAPLAPMLQEVARLADQGFDTAIAPFDLDLACQWCHGTGEPALSVSGMEAALR